MKRISFIGAGNMAQALVGGLLKAGHEAGAISAADPFAEARASLAELGVNVSDSNVETVRDAEVIVLAVKPQVLTEVLRDMAAELPADALLISIVAGMPLAAITHAIRTAAKPAPNPAMAIVRCMPNTPALLGLGITGMHANAAVSDVQRRQAETLAEAA